MHKFKKLMHEAVEKELPAEKMEEITDIISHYLHILDKKNRHRMYMEIDVVINGWELSKEQAKKYVSCMENKDKTTGQYWSYEQVEQYAKNKGINFDEYCFGLPDLYWAMNMEHSDNYGIIEKMTSDSSRINDFYCELAMNFLNDKDAPDGKAKRYIYSIM